MKRFSDFATESNTITGDKIKIEDKIVCYAQ